MKKIFLAFSVFAMVACGSSSDEGTKFSKGIDEGVIIVENFRNTGVDFRIENTGLTRSYGVYDEYEMEAVMPDGVALKGIIQVEALPSGDQIVSLYRVSDFIEDEIFIGSYQIDNQMIVNDIAVGDYPVYGSFDQPLDPILADKIAEMTRQPDETYWQCVKREWKEMKEAYQNRPLDDIACDVIEPACKALALVAAAYECGK